MTRLDDNKRVKELENELEIKTNFIEHQYIPLIKELTYENQRYKQALEDIRDITTGSANKFAIQALKGETE